MKTLSILQPWAHAILHFRKDIENRDWRTNFRGRFLIHVGKGFDEDGQQFLLRMDMRGELPGGVPPRSMYLRGGILGSAVLRDCVRASDSRWFFGDYGFVLQGAKPISFIPFKGALGFFDVPDELVREALAA